MKQLTCLGGRLLGKKSVAIILGLLGLCCPSSLWAEKLDTTFVLDMVIDSTPCYYTKYGNKGNIVSSGRYTSSDYFRINVGYVTNGNGETIDTLTYVCDPVTKQWKARTLYGSSDQVYFYGNGMLKTIKREAPMYISVVEYENYVKFLSDGFPDEEVYSLHSHDGGANFSRQNSKTQYDTHGNILEHSSSGSSYHQGGSAWSNGSSSSESSYKNKYDAKGNLIEVELTSKTRNAEPDEYDVPGRETTDYTSSRMEHIYDSQNRRIKTITYQSNHILDSIVYTYGHAWREGEPCLLTIQLNGEQIDSFSSDKYQYDFSDNPSCYVLDYEKDVRYIVPSGSYVGEFSYDSKTRQLTISVFGRGSSSDSSNKKTYTIRFSAPESYITSMTSNRKPVEDFSSNKYEYDFSDSTFAWSWGLDYEFSPGSTVKKSYDDSTNTLSIRVYGADFEQDLSNMHTYSIRCKAPEAYLTSLSFNGSSVDSFSPTVFKYTLPDLYSPQERRISYTVSSGSIVTETVDGTSLCITITDELHTQKNEYVINYSTMEACLTSLSIKGKSVSDFSWDKYEYDFSDSLEYHEWDVSYTLQQLGVRVNRTNMKSEDWEIFAHTRYIDTTGVLEISINYEYIGPGSKGTADMKTYVIKFKKLIQSLVDTYYVALQPCVISISMNDNYVCEAIDKLEHNMIGEYNPEIFKYELPAGVAATESYDDSTHVLTLTARFITGDTTAKTEYHIHFIYPSFSSLTINEEPLDIFSADTFDYWFDTEYNPDVVSYTLPDGVTATESFDDSTNVLSIRLATDNASKPIEYKLHFRPLDGVDDFLGDHVNLYITDKTICIDGATEPICVYDLLGTLVGTGRGEEVRIPVRQAGVYVVRAGRKAAKVVVK